MTTMTSLSSTSQNFLSQYQVCMTENTSQMEAGLPTDFQPTANDIVCGRGKGGFNRAGNKRFRAMVRQHIPAYTAAKTKVDKSAVIDNILDRVQSMTPAPRFVAMKAGSWVEISQEQAREKVGHSMREAIAEFESAAERFETKKVFNTKQHDLLAEQKAIFEALVREMGKNKPRSAQAKAARAA